MDEVSKEEFLRTLRQHAELIAGLRRDFDAMSDGMDEQTRMIRQTNDLTGEMRDALLGTFDDPGLVETIRNVNDWRTSVCNTFWMIFKPALGLLGLGVIVGVGWLIAKGMH